jgi:hypothetical protein
MRKCWRRWETRFGVSEEKFKVSVLKVNVNDYGFTIYTLLQSVETIHFEKKEGMNQ